MTSNPPRQRPISFQLIVLLAIIALGLTLYFWAIPRTPIAAKPAHVEVPQ